MNNECDEDGTSDNSNITIVHYSEVNEYDESTPILSTSAVLFDCKRKILLPYQRLLALIGLRTIEQPCCNVFLPLLGLAFVLGGYVIRYMLCFRRDLGLRNSDDTCDDNLLYNHIFPGLLHLAGYLQALLVMRIRETERLEMLMERTFLLAAHRSAGTGSTKILVRCLWLCVICSIVWVAASITNVIIILRFNFTVVRWVTTSSLGKILLEVLLILTTLWQDLLQATIVATYCLQVMLLYYTVILLRLKLIQHSCQPLEWVREVSECQQDIKYLNEDLSPAVSLLILLDVAWAGTGFLALAQHEKEASVVNCLIVGLWISIAAAPVVAAACLTTACDSVRWLGHEVRARPFVYQSTPARDLDTLLLFTASLRLHAKLCGFPVSSHYLILLLAIAFVVILILGQSGVL